MKIEFSPADLRPLVKEVITEVLARVEADHARLNGQLAYPEAEAAATLGIAKHALRDLRLSGHVVGCRLGRKVVYERGELEKLLGENRCQK